MRARQATVRRLVLLGGPRDGEPVNWGLSEAPPARLRAGDPHTGELLIYLPTGERSRNGREVYQFHSLTEFTR